MVSHVRSLSPPPGQKAEEKPLGFGADAYMLTHLTSTREPRTVGPAERHRLVYYETGAPRSPHATADTSAISPKKPDYASWGHTRAETASSAPFSTSPSKAPRSSTFTLDKVESVAASEEKTASTTTAAAPSPAPAAEATTKDESNTLAPEPPPQESWVDSAMAAEEAAQQASLEALARMKANDDAALGEALPLLEECLNKLRTQTSASHHPLVIELMETYAAMLYAKGDDEAANAVVREIACKRLVKEVVSNVAEGRVGVAKQQAVEEAPQKSGWLWW